MKLTAQYLPTPAAITWQNMDGDKVGFHGFPTFSSNHEKIVALISSSSCLTRIETICPLISSQPQDLVL